MLKQRQNSSGKRSDKRNGKLTKSNFSLKSLVGFGSATGGRNFLGMCCSISSKHLPKQCQHTCLVF